jgi:hypothetical protein
LAFSKDQGRTWPFAKSSGTLLAILPI